MEQQYAELEAQYRKLEDLLKSAGSEEDVEEEEGQQSSGDGLGMRERLQKLLEELRTQAQEIARLKVEEKALRERMAQLEKEREEARATIGDLEDQVTALQEKRADLEKQLARALARIDELEAEIARLRAQLDKMSTLVETQQLVLDQNRETIEALRRLTDTRDVTNEKHSVQRDRFEDLARVTALQDELRRRDEMIEELKDKLRRERELLRRRYLSRWRNNTPSCEGCGLLFSLRNRRHHCRLCGRVMCHACCSDRVRTSSNRRPVRVCRDCFDLIGDIEQEEHEVMQNTRSAFEQARRASDHSALVSVTITKSQAGDPVGADFHYYDLEFELKVTVARVLDHTPASAAGLKPGMLILGVNGREVSEMLREEFDDILRKDTEIVLETVTATAVERARANSVATTSSTGASRVGSMRSGSGASSPHSSPALRAKATSSPLRVASGGGAEGRKEGEEAQRSTTAAGGDDGDRGGAGNGEGEAEAEGEQRAATSSAVTLHVPPATPAVGDNEAAEADTGAETADAGEKPAAAKEQPLAASSNSSSSSNNGSHAGNVSKGSSSAHEQEEAERGGENNSWNPFFGSASSAASGEKRSGQARVTSAKGARKSSAAGASAVKRGTGKGAVGALRAANGAAKTDGKQSASAPAPSKEAKRPPVRKVSDSFWDDDDDF